MPHTELITMTRRPETRLERWMASLRSITLGPFNPKDKTIARYFGGTPSLAGVSVTADNVLQYSPVWAAVNLIAGDLSGLPLMLFKRLAAGGKERYSGHPLYELLHDRPNPEMGSEVFRETIQAHALIYGNGYAEIERGGPTGTQPVALWPLMPWQVEPIKEGYQPLSYRVWNPATSSYVQIPAVNMVHLRGLGTGVCGHDLVGMARHSLGLGIATERFGSAFFGNGATFGGMVIADAMGDKAFASLSEALKRRHQGVENAHRLLLLPSVKDFKPFGIPANQAQFLETRQFQVEEVARWFGIAPYLLRRTEGTASYASTEQQRRDYYTTLYRWAKKWESELQAKLVFPAERHIQFIEHVWESFLAADTAARGQFYKALFDMGAITPNEIRERENLNPVTGGDQAFVQLNLVPLDLAQEMAQAQIEKQQAPPRPEGDAEELQQELDRERAAHAETTRQFTALQVASATVDARLTVSEGQREKAEDALVALRGTHAELASKAAELDARLADTLSMATDRAEASERLTARLAVCEGERDAARVDQGELGRACEAERLAHVATGLERDSLRTALDAARRVEQDRSAEIETLRAGIEAARAAEAQAVTRATHATGERDAATATAQAAIEDASRHSRLATDAQAAAAQAQALQEAAERALQTTRDAVAQRLTALTTAHRAQVVDALTRFVAIEADKARSNSATPAKLANWMKRFYPQHEQACVDRLVPLLSVHLALVGSSEDPVTVARDLMRGHVQASLDDLNVMVECDPPEEMGAALEHVLARWERHRPTAIADRLTQEAITAVRSWR